MIGAVAAGTGAADVGGALLGGADEIDGEGEGEDVLTTVTGAAAFGPHAASAAAAARINNAFDHWRLLLTDSAFPHVTLPSPGNRALDTH